MASIESLLNPVPEIRSYQLSRSTDTATFRTPRQKRQRIAKDAPIYHKGKIRGELRYPPCEERDEELTRIHEEFKVHPLGNIADFPRHIPYNSDKKSFQERTGREFFEVFQYTFKIPGDEKEWIVMWDYNTGLVRTTHLFKCNEYSKTTPGKMLNANPGLRDICHSITGGALAAQGYWMPYDAAKAVAATFCYRVRHALTPLFGLDFPDLCAHPLDRMRFGRMIIDPAIVRQSTETANYYRMLELSSPTLSVPPGSLPIPSTSSTERGGSKTGGFAARKQLFPRSHKKHADNISTTTASTTSSGYGSSPDEYNSDTYCISPVSPFGSSFTPVNTPRSADTAHSGAGVCTSAKNGASSSNNVGIPTPSEILASVSARPAVASANGMGSSLRTGKSVETDDGMDDNNTETSSTGSDMSSISTDSLSLDLNDDKGEDYQGFKDHENSKTHGISTIPDANTTSRRKMTTRSSSHYGQSSALFAREVKAAHALLSLHMQDASGSECDGDGDGNGGAMSVSSLMGVHQRHQQGRGYFSQGRKRRRAST